MKIDDIFKFEIEAVPREQIQFAFYNPRKISDSAKKKLRKRLKTKGLITPIVWNKQTGNLVGGHQRLAIIDRLVGKDDYVLPKVSVIDCSEAEEVEHNLFLNNVSAQGEWDHGMMFDINEQWPELDLIEGAGFDHIDLEFFSQSEGRSFEFKREETAEVVETNPQTEDQEATIGELHAMDKMEKLKEHEKINALKKEYKNKEITKDKEQGGTLQTEYNDYTVTFVFNNNKDKHNFMEKIGKARTEKFVKFELLFDLAKGKFNLFE